METKGARRAGPSKGQQAGEQALFGGLRHLQGNDLGELLGTLPRKGSVGVLACQPHGLREPRPGKECSMLGMPADQPHHTPHPDSGFWIQGLRPRPPLSLREKVRAIRWGQSRPRRTLGCLTPWAP